MESVFSFETSIDDKLVVSSCQTIEQLYHTYADDLYMTSKIHHYITNQLPTLLENIKATRERNLQRVEEHQCEHERFIQSFLGQNKYFYHTSNESFFVYDGIHYRNISEDDILHDIVSTISRDRNPMLMNWKHKTKVSALKRIKDNSILRAIPESTTIQTVLQKLQPYVVSSKTEAKYFLTVLGDNLLKKHLDRIHFVSPSLKEFLRELNMLCIGKLNIQCTQTFKYKYHEKHYEQNEDCRLVPTPDLMLPTDWYTSLVIDDGLDILCVALHYSHKYGSSDEYVVEKSGDADLQRYVFELQHVSPDHRMRQFIQEYLHDFEANTTCVSSSPQDESFLQTQLIPTDERSLTWKQIQYLWKDFLAIHKLPLHMYSSFYKTSLVENFFPHKYDVNMDSFALLGSSQFPLIRKFLRFWSETMVEDTNDYAELEIDEVSALFRMWLQQGNPKKKQKYWLKESKIVDILTHFHPEVEIADAKYVYHTRNLLWDKDMDIEASLMALRERRTSDDPCASPPRAMSVYDAYEHYCHFYHTKPLAVSKCYFENYVGHHYGNQLDHNHTFIPSWFHPE